VEQTIKPTYFRGYLPWCLNHVYTIISLVVFTSYRVSKMTVPDCLKIDAVTVLPRIITSSYSVCYHWM